MLSFLQLVLIIAAFQSGKVVLGTTVVQTIPDFIQIADEIIAVFICHFQLDDTLGTAAYNACVVDDLGGAIDLMEDSQEEKELSDQKQQKNNLGDLLGIWVLLFTFGLCAIHYAFQLTTVL